MRLITTNGFTTVAEKPSSGELERYYNDKYFGAERQNQYARDYTANELIHKDIDCEETLVVSGKPAGSLLDVGCGEGFFLKFFADRGWIVRGLDFTSTGLERRFPDLRGKLQTGNVFDLLAQDIASGAKYDLVVCNNVLEHVIDPLQLLADLKGVVAPGGVVRFAVPNDDSWLQRLVVALGRAKEDFWVCPPEHLNYFTVESLRSVLRHAGWRPLEVLTSFPVEFYLLNSASNYAADRSLGRRAHFARVDFEVGLRQQSLDKLIAFRRSCADVGIGRNTAAYVTLEDDERC